MGLKQQRERLKRLEIEFSLLLVDQLTQYLKIGRAFVSNEPKAEPFASTFNSPELFPLILSRSLIVADDALVEATTVEMIAAYKERSLCELSQNSIVN